MEATRRQWAPEHVELARAAVHVREGLRRMLPDLPEAQRSRVGNLANILTFALKARPARLSLPGGKETI
ncbi:hypothetical protein F183_A29760 [Bryobacterales bacterium F-183]|nr:hypothetical protein F183_A29760 [Bryobacterales bacterium F-183]